ncbi:MAG TPA: chemotaxis protein CheB, partial [Noviherbaspirillum sp.]
AQKKALMPDHHVVVVGASAGGVESLQALVSSLPPDLNAAIFVVLHISPNYVSHLPDILSRRGPFPATHPAGRELIRAGRIYVAPPDHHLLIEGEHVVATRGPKENRNRPSIDALFRSAAYHYRDRAIGIVLSGALDDGTSGLWNIKRMGGIAITQDVAECAFDSMPSSALAQVDVDFSLSASGMGQLLDRLVQESAQMSRKDTPQVQRQGDPDSLIGLEVDIAIGDQALEKGMVTLAPPSPFACPECHGVMMEIREGKRTRYRCHTGHAYSTSALLSELMENVDQSYWKAMRGLEEAAMLLGKASEELRESNRHDAAELFRQESERTRQQAEKIREIVLSSKRYSGDSLVEKAEQEPGNQD